MSITVTKVLPAVPSIKFDKKLLSVLPPFYVSDEVDSEVVDVTEKYRNVWDLVVNNAKYYEAVE